MITKKKRPKRATPLREIVDAYIEHQLAFGSQSTIYQYGLNLRRFGEYLEREPTIDDLTDMQITGAMAYVIKTLELSVSSANKLRDDFLAVWRWAARKRIVDHWPDVKELAEPIRIPIAWSREQLQVLWDCCARQPGDFYGIPCGLWWHSLHAVAWDTAERIGALVVTEWSQIDLDARWIVVRAELRKGKRADKLSRLHPTTCDLLRRIKTPQHSRVWPWPYCACYLWKWYTTMLKRAHLPHDRAHKFHALRKSCASYLEAVGGDAQAFLGHSDRNITNSVYIDPRISLPPQAADRLFRPDSADGYNTPAEGRPA